MINHRAFTGYYRAKNKNKYAGDARDIYFRSSWERSFCKWCDVTHNVVKWAIEPFKIPYFDTATGKARVYNPDFYIEMYGGVKYLIEVKPKYQTMPPKMKEGTKKYITEEATYKTNTSKWKAAREFCERKKWVFKIVTEETLAAMGIKIMTSIPRLKRKGTSKKNVKYTNKTSRKKVQKRKPQKGKKACR